MLMKKLYARNKELENGMQKLNNDDSTKDINGDAQVDVQAMKQREIDFAEELEKRDKEIALLRDQ